MSDTYVLDTEAVIAFLYGEPGHDVVADLLADVFDGTADGYLAEANASEVFYLVARFEGTGNDVPTEASLRTADRDIRALERRGMNVERTDWRLAGEVKADGHISLADAHAVALADDRNATLVAGADDDFEELPVDVDLLRFRDHGV
jgi:predicted nucleic acid-binding protein